jgi:hypothetical protein
VTCLPCHIFGVGKEAVTRIGFGGSGCVSVSQQQEKEFNTLDGSGTREAFILSHQDASTLRSLVISGKKKPQRRVIHLQTARVICDGFVFKMCVPRSCAESYTHRSLVVLAPLLMHFFGAPPTFSESSTTIKPQFLSQILN